MRAARWIVPIAAVALSFSSCKEEKAAPETTPETTEDRPEAPDKKPSDQPASPAKTADAAAAAAPGPDIEALGTVDPTVAASRLADYRTLRPIFKVESDGDFTPSAAQRKVLSAIAGKGGFKAIESVAADAGWAAATRQTWLRWLAESSRDGFTSVVRMPLRQCVGWGSATPSDYVAVGCFNAAVVFIHPVGDTTHVRACDACNKKSEAKLAACRDKRCEMVVEGYFTGETRETEGGPPGEPGPVAYQFHIQKSRTGKTATTLRLPGGHGAAGGPAINSGPRWGVMWASAFATGKDPAAAAAKVAGKLKVAGFTNAEVIDSRRIPTLWCCSQAVLAGRFDTRAAAKAMAKTAGKGVKDLIVREIY